jgi:hypothetical protein
MPQTKVNSYRRKGRKVRKHRRGYRASRGTLARAERTERTYRNEALTQGLADNEGIYGPREGYLTTVLEIQGNRQRYVKGRFYRGTFTHESEGPWQSNPYSRGYVSPVHLRRAREP